MKERRKKKGMPSVRVSRLCALRQKDVHQPSRPHRHAKRPPMRRQGMLPSSSSNPAATTSELDACTAEQYSNRPVNPHPIMKRRLRTILCSRESRSPSAHVKISRRIRALPHDLRVGNVRAARPHDHAHADHDESPSHHGKVGTYRKPASHGLHAHYHDSPNYDSYRESVGTYQRLRSSKGMFDNGILEDGDHGCLDSGRSVDCQKVSHLGDTDGTSIVLPCLEGLAATKHMRQVLNLREKKNKIPNTVLYKSMRHRPSNAISNERTKNDLSNGNDLHSHRKARDSSGHKQRLTALINFDEESPKCESAFSSKQSSLFLYDGIFYHTPKRRLRRSNNIGGCKKPPQYTAEMSHTRRPNRRSNANDRCHERKVTFHDSATTSHERSALPDRISPPLNDAGGNCGNLAIALKGQSLDDLEWFAVHESAGTTEGIKKCVQIAENMNSVVANTLNALHQQGEKTKGAHEYTLEIDQNLSAGEKILGSFGGFFSKTWKPVKTRAIKGPLNVNPSRSKSADKLKSGPLDPGRALLKNRPDKSNLESATRVHLPWQAKVKNAEREQDVGLTDLSSIISELKKMSLNMGNELSRQSEALDPFRDEVVELSQRLKRANLRGRFLLA